MLGKRQHSVSTVFVFLKVLMPSPVVSAGGSFTSLSPLSGDILSYCNWKILLASSGKRPGICYNAQDGPVPQLPDHKVCGMGTKKPWPNPVLKHEWSSVLVSHRIINISSTYPIYLRKLGNNAEVKRFCSKLPGPFKHNYVIDLEYEIS